MHAQSHPWFSLQSVIPLLAFFKVVNLMSFMLQDEAVVEATVLLQVRKNQYNGGQYTWSSSASGEEEFTMHAHERLVLKP